MFARSVIGIDHVAARAAARAIIAGLIVGAGKPRQRIQQARLLQAQKNRIGAKLCAETAAAELDVRPAGIFLPLRIADLAFRPAAALEDAQYVAGLRNLPALERRHFRQDAVHARLIRRGRRYGVHGLWRAIAGVAFAEARVFVGIRAVVVERGAPQDSAGGHHAGLHRTHFGCVAARAAARFWRHAQVAGIDEAHILGTLTEPTGISAHRICRIVRPAGVARGDMRLQLHLFIGCRICRGTIRLAGSRVATVAIGAAQSHVSARMHGGLVGLNVAGDAPRALAIGIGLGLAEQVRAGWRLRRPWRHIGKTRGCKCQRNAS